MKNDITIIIPINNTTGDFPEMFPKALKSVEEQEIKPEKIIIVYCQCPGPMDWFKEWKKPEGVEIELLENPTGEDFCSQINYAVEHTTTTWFSILEFDDEYSKIWLKSAREYIEYYGNVSLFFPIVVDVDSTNNFIGFTNESVWAVSFSEKLGMLDNSTLLRYQNYQLSGAIIKTEEFLEIGGLKSSMKLTFTYEFLLRATYNDFEIMTIPKIGYRHMNMREWSLFWNYKNHPEQKLAGEEAKFWVDLAKKEYFFTDDRRIAFEIE